MLVDGEKFQVKCLDDIGGLKDHFGENYRYPVLANSELADKIPTEWADKVFFVEGCSNELISHVTESSMAAGADVLSPAVPVFALVVSAVRNLMKYNVGKVSGTQAVEQVVLDGSTRASLAVAGGYLERVLGFWCSARPVRWYGGRSFPCLPRRRQADSWDCWTGLSRPRHTRNGHQRRTSPLMPS
ncbi:MAG: hypothetical protein M3461_23250 [Pseudomonadota bacterium]|nr:hypothetical protein [Pseudomonadota bacterium]